MTSLEVAWAPTSTHTQKPGETGSLKMPHGNLLDRELNPDLKEPVPAPPKLNELVLIGDTDEKKSLACPVALVREWGSHPTFGKDFNQWLEKFCENHSVVDPNDADAKKRKNEGKDSTAAQKKLKGDVHAVELNTITETLIMEAKLTGVPKDSAYLQIREKHTVYLVNKSNNELQFTEHQYIAGFGRGHFKLYKPEEMPEDAIMVRLKGSDDTVFINNISMTLEEVLRDARAKKPAAQVCYHDLIPDEDFHPLLLFEHDLWLELVTIIVAGLADSVWPTAFHVMEGWCGPS